MTSTLLWEGDKVPATGALEFEAVVWPTGISWVAALTTFGRPLIERTFFNRASARLWVEETYKSLEEALS